MNDEIVKHLDVLYAQVKEAAVLVDDATRQELKKLVDDYLEELKAKREIYDYGAICDAANNPPSDCGLNCLVQWKTPLDLQIYVYPLGSDIYRRAVQNGLSLIGTL